MLFLSGEKANIPYSLSDSMRCGAEPSHGAYWPAAGETAEGDRLG